MPNDSRTNEGSPLAPQERALERPPVYEDISDSQLVTHPVWSLVHISMLPDGWTLNKDHITAFIFDAITPYKEFKESMQYDPDEEYPDRSLAHPDDVIGDDCEPGFMPFAPIPYEMRYRINCDIQLETFMTWTAGELRTFQIGTPRSGSVTGSPSPIAFEDAQILAPYDRIICQLLAEDRHGDFDTSHDALHRQSYARRVLDLFAKEYRSFKGPITSFRSKFLSPILARQRWAVPDTYSWPVANAIGKGPDVVTIAEATEFYLGEDPTDISLIPRYRSGIIRIPQARWHLATLMNVAQVGDRATYETVGDNQAEMVDTLWKEWIAPKDPSIVKGVLRPAEVTVIVEEKLESFFGPELSRVAKLREETIGHRMEKEWVADGGVFA